MKIAFFEVNFIDSDHPHKIRTSGLDWYRVVNPALHLKKITDWQIDIFKNPFEKNSKFKNWKDITSYYDIGFTLYFPNYNLYTYLLSQSEKNKMTLTVDIDDNLWEIPPNHRLYPHWHIGAKFFHIYYQIARTAPYLTTTNELLKSKLERITLNKRIEILPNYIDLDKYSTSNNKKSNNCTIVYFGTDNHRHDVELPYFIKAMIRLSHIYPNLIFKIIGMSKLPVLTKELNKHYKVIKGNKDYLKFLEIWKDHIATADIAVAPLAASSFSRCKSPLKFYESAAGYLPFVCSDILPYRGVVEQGVTGFLCKTEDDWYQALSKLIKSKELRIKIGNNAYNYVKDKCTIQKNIWRYKEFFEKVYNTKILYN